MNEWLWRQRTVEGTPSIQPLPVEVGVSQYKLNHLSPITNLEKGTNAKITVIAPVGFNVANPVDFTGVPVQGAVPIGVDKVRWSDSPLSRGGCS